MERKYCIYKVGLLLTAMMAFGCSDKEVIPDTPINPPTPPTTVSKVGTAIEFMTDNVQTRTVYGDAKNEIWWLDGGKDDIVIYSNEATVGTPRDGETEAVAFTPATQQAEYRVNPADDAVPHGRMSPWASNKTMLWGEEVEHTFYAAYPQQRFVGFANDGKEITMQYITNQVCDVVSSENGQYKTAPDMLNAYMVAKNKLAPTNSDEHNLLYFDPIMTTLDIHVTAGKYEVGTGIIQAVTVTGVSVIMPKHLVNGEFTYDLSADGDTKPSITGHSNHVWNLKTGTVADGAESVFVNIRTKEKEGNKYYVDLFEGESIDVMAFLPPVEIAESSDCYVKVHTTAGYDFIKRITTAEIGKRNRVTIKLPDIYPEGAGIPESEEARKGNPWMSRFDASLPINQMTIPGYVFGDTNKDNADKIIEEITDAYKLGYRAFDVTAILSEDNDVYHFVQSEAANDPVMDKFRGLTESIFLYYNTALDDKKTLGYWSSTETKTNFWGQKEERKIYASYSGFTEMTHDATNSLGNSDIFVLVKYHEYIGKKAHNEYFVCNNGGGTHILDFNQTTIGTVHKIDDVTLDTSKKISENQWYIYYVSADEANGTYNWFVSDEGQHGHCGLVFISDPMSDSGKMLLNSIIDSNFKYHRESTQE